MAVRDIIPTVARVRLLEREHHLSTLADLLDDATRGVGRLAMIRGDAGTGKTALLRAFLGDLPHSVETAVGYCDPIATPRPLSPIHDLARSLGNGLGSLLERSATREEIRDHLLEQFVEQPVVIAIEDIQWADDATIDLIRLLARRIGDTSALLLLTYREEPRASVGVARLLGQLATSPGAKQIEVAPLSRSAMAILTAGTSIDPGMLYRLTSGNPFFASELLAADGPALPRSIRDLIRGRVAELDDRARAALDAAAVLGSRIEPWLLAAVTGEALPGIDDAIAVGLVLRDGDGLSFRHELARVVVLEDLPVIRGIGLHRSALAALRRAGVSDAARLAHHAEGAADGAAVLEFGPQAARQALANGAYREAIAQLGRSVRFASPTDDRRVELLEQLGDAQMVVANGVAADEAWTEALAIRRERGDPPRLIGDLVRRIAKSAMWRADFARAMALAREAVAILEPLGESRELAMAVVGLSGQLMMEAHAEEAIQWGERALVLGDRLGDDEVRALALNYIGSSEVGLGREAGLDSLERSLAIARANNLSSAIYRGLFNLAASAWGLQLLHRSEVYFDELIRFSASSEVISCNIDANRADLLLRLGRWDEAEASASNALQVADEGLDPLDASTATSVLARLRARRGQAGAEALIDHADELVSAANDLYRTWIVVGVRAEIAWLSGDLRTMVPPLGELLDQAMELGDPWVTGEIATWLQRADAARPGLPNVAEPYRLSLAGDWRAASSAWRDRDNPFETALALLEADEPAALREAYDILLGLGAHGVLPIAIGRLRAFGGPIPRGPRRSTVAHAALLTEREAEIAALLAAGHSNREIAERLVVSERTVGHHVSAVLGKLGVRRRGEVAARLAAGDAAPR
jgi:DNA-binding CsgD family transcriptional regulator/tetratricopeptide (TPR) repeat protein